jgi:hypothetical protein
MNRQMHKSTRRVYESKGDRRVKTVYCYTQSKEEAIGAERNIFYLLINLIGQQYGGI